MVAASERVNAEEAAPGMELLKKEEKDEKDIYLCLHVQGKKLLT